MDESEQSDKESDLDDNQSEQNGMDIKNDFTLDEILSH